jgi:sugar phosphate isomerase/epimerase
MRLGGPIFEKYAGPDEWAAAVRRSGYTAAYAPVTPDASDEVVSAYAKAAQAADIVIAEVGAWSNPIDCDAAKANAAIVHCQRCLDLAERIGARCCVNIVGSRNPVKWDAPHPTNFSRETFDLIVESTRKIIDAVQPKRTFYTLETMPWIFPSSPDEYLDLIRAIDCPGFAVHLDPVNLVNSPPRYCSNADLIRECFAKLGPRIKSCHAKDIILREQLTVHLDECRPGTGFLDYAVFLRELAKLDPDTTLMLEHLPDDEYAPAAAHIRKIVAENKLELQ